MAKAQVSFEFIVVFAFLLFIFATVLGFFPIGLEKTASTKDLAEKLARDIKAKVITASLAKSDFEAEVALPDKINSADIEAIVIKEPDNILIIKEKAKEEALAKAFLPVINDATGNPDGLILKIKKSGNSLTLDLQ